MGARATHIDGRGGVLWIWRLLHYFIRFPRARAKARARARAMARARARAMASSVPSDMQYIKYVHYRQNCVTAIVFRHEQSYAIYTISSACTIYTVHYNVFSVHYSQHTTYTTYNIFSTQHSKSKSIIKYQEQEQMHEIQKTLTTFSKAL